MMANRGANTDESYGDCLIQRQSPVVPVHTHRDGSTHASSRAPNAGTRGLAIALVLTALFLVAEVLGGVLSNSLALLADAGHMATDVGALALSLFVAWFSGQPATPQKTYGYLRWEILAAFLNGAVLLIASAFILWESVNRLASPEPIVGGLMLGVALMGLGVNALSAWLLHAGAHQSMNIRGAYLHVLGDLLGSVAAIVAAVLVRWKGWMIADPIASVAMTTLIVVGAWRLVREAVDVLLESTPAHIELNVLRRAMTEIRGVEEVHDLHVWTLTSGVIAMSGHAVSRDAADHQRVLEELHAAVGRFGIYHTTIQVECVPLYACCPLAAPAALAASAIPSPTTP